MTLIDTVLKKFGMLFERKMSVTTRPKRQIEKAEGNFLFVSVEEFKKMQAAGSFIECREKGGHWHGTSYAELERIKALGKIPIIEVDYEGAREINNQALEANFLFIYPPSFEELRKRIGNRIETEADFKLRIKEAINQIELANKSVLFTNRLVNDELNSAKAEVFTLVEALYFQELKKISDT